MKKKIDERPTNVLVMDNNFVKATYDGRMSIHAMKLVRTAIAQCKMNDDEFYEYEVSVVDIAKLFNVKGNSIYEKMQKACIQAFKTDLYIGDGDPKHQWKLYHMFQTCEFNPKSNMIRFQMAKEMTPFFLELKKNFTKIELGNILTMKSKYSMRIYELIICEMKSQKVYADKTALIYLSLNELRKSTSTENKFKQVGQFKEKVLRKAIQEINESDNGYYISYIDKKKGRSVEGFEFLIESRLWHENKLLSKVGLNQ